MEDAYTAFPFLIEVPISSRRFNLKEMVPPRIAPQVNPVRGVSGDLDNSVEMEADEPSEVIQLEPLHFFGVFDGHGGVGAALLCARRLHIHIAEGLETRHKRKPPVLTALDMMEDESIEEVSASSSAEATEEAAAAAAAAIAFSASAPAAATEDTTPSFVGGSGHDRINTANPPDKIGNETAASEGDNDSEPEGKEGQPCLMTHFNTAFTDAFLKVDDEFSREENASLVGTTAVIALVGNRQLYLGNCGDSRAILCRGGVAIALTDDHKAGREDETARIEAAGGQILFWNGVRVMGVLAVSRAIGDHCLRPFVIAKPEVTIIRRHAADELLLLASDGLWDVMSNQEACSLARRCLRRAHHRGASRNSAARIAATVLTRAALDRGSRDNVTIVIVDLSRQQSDKPSGNPISEEPDGDETSPAVRQSCVGQAPCPLTDCACHKPERRPSLQLPVIAAPHGDRPPKDGPEQQPPLSDGLKQGVPEQSRGGDEGIGHASNASPEE